MPSSSMATGANRAQQLRFTTPGYRNRLAWSAAVLQNDPLTFADQGGPLGQLRLG